MIRATLRALGDLARWAVRRTPAVPGHAIGYSDVQRGMMPVLAGVLVVETVAVEVLLFSSGVPLWLRLTVGAADVSGVLGVVATAVSCQVRPHVAGEGVLLVRYGALFELAVPYSAVADVRSSANFNEEGLIRLAHGVLRVAVSSQTNVVVELRDELEVPGRGKARTVRLYADDPRAATAAIRRAVAGAGEPAGS
ncbi:hypothetical protein [Sinosporangium siamense]|uniref:Uncharacterized protein n=1 Tax=Sinosporangium siamense TaxID=1367973 RepID=A0A919RF10_9ACTN|nr:hypothetical protein [Sinosporangium siamense]GII90564.1 hypothetical protein Ssi02_07950 [Sinosporangium siamense]